MAKVAIIGAGSLVFRKTLKVLLDPALAIANRFGKLAEA